MDWSAWLSKSSLQPSLAHEYGLLFSNNELEEEDIKHLDHEFLLSMGISVGKHRLEILKLGRKERKGIASTVRKLRKCVANYVQMLTHSTSSAIVAVPKAADGWQRASSTRLLTAKEEKLMITNGNPIVHNCSKEVRWDTMFKDLKPT